MNKLDLAPPEIVESLPPASVPAAAMVNGRWIEDWTTGTEKLCCTVNAMGSPTLVTLGSIALTAPESVREEYRQKVVEDAFRRHF